MKLIETKEDSRKFIMGYNLMLLLKFCLPGWKKEHPVLSIVHHLGAML